MLEDVDDIDELEEIEEEVWRLMEETMGRLGEDFDPSVDDDDHPEDDGTS